MLNLSESPAAVTECRRATAGRRVLRACRPALIDLRFKGDPWVVDSCEGTAAVCLGDYALLKICASALDLPSLNRAWLALRFGQARRQYTNQRRRAAKN
jgi:hypothetical protein